MATVPVKKPSALKSVYKKNNPFVSAALFAREMTVNPYKEILGSNEGLSVSTKNGYSTAMVNLRVTLGYKVGPSR